MADTRKTVLFVDDDQDIRVVVSRLIASRGHEVVTAENGKEAIALLEGGTRPDLVILDVVMPEMDGLATLVRIRKDLGLTDLPVVMLTGQDSDRDVLKGYDVGADYYITKPLKFDHLFNVVDYLIGDLTAEQRAQLEQKL